MKKLARLFNYRFTPVLLLLVTIVSYGVFSRAIGFLMDDWYIAWFGKTFGAAQYIDYFSLDRPLMGYFFTAAFTLLGHSVSPFVWQVFALLLRWLCTYALWGMLNAVWPDARKQNTWVALLAAVFPGFTQHWIAVVYSFFYACLAGFFFSITLMVRALKQKKWFWVYYPLSVLIGFYCVASSEFYYGLEIIRLVVLWLFISRESPGFWKRVLQTIKYYAAYLLLFGAFAIWRLFFFVSMNHKVSIVDQLKSRPLDTLIESVRQVYQSIYHAVIGSWAQTFDLTNYPSKGAMSWAILVLVIAAFVAVYFWTRRTDAGMETNSGEPSNWGREAFWMGLLGMVFAILPFWAGGLTVDNAYPYDRFLLAYLPGVCLWLVAVMDLLFKNKKQIILVVSLLVALGVGFQFTQGLHYRNTWNQQVTLYWQLVWRMPGIEPDTTVMAWTLPHREYYSDQALSAELNWTYADDIGDNRVVPYKFALLQSNIKAEFANLEPNVDFEDNFRTYTFQGNTSQSVLIWYDGENCLRVLDADLTLPESVTTSYTRGMTDASNLSNLSLILQEDGSNPPLNVVGAEPDQGWCYYFEKAELARQNQEYENVISLLEQAQGKGLNPKVPSEWYPFLDAYLHLGSMEEALEISQILKDTGDKVYEIGLCKTWSNFQAETSDPAALETIDLNMKALSCK